MHPPPRCPGSVGLQCQNRAMTESASARPTSIRLFLADGTPDGFRMVEKSNWTGLGLVSSRSGYPTARKREAWAKPGVYILNGPPTGKGLRDRVYIGEGDDVRSRVDAHLKSKEFWTGVVAFTSKDESLNKAHVRYLEARLLQIAALADRADLDNQTAPTSPPLSEADRADADGFLREMLPILPLLGVSAFEAVETPASAAELLRLKGKDADATGADTSEGFVIFADSLARGDAVPSTHTYLIGLRQTLLSDGVLQPHGNHLRFVKPWIFNSPSTAAGVVLGRSANGRVEWRNVAGQTLKQIQEQSVA